MYSLCVLKWLRILAMEQFLTNQYNNDDENSKVMLTLGLILSQGFVDAIKVNLNSQSECG